MLGVGLHFLLDGATSRCLTGLDLINYIQSVASPSGIDMQIVVGPSFVIYGARTEAWAIIAESHISVTVTGGRLALEVFSCRPFDPVVPALLAEDLLGLRPGYKTHCLSRVGVGKAHHN